MANFQEVGQQFLQHYYSVFDTNREQLSALYTNESMLTFEGEQKLGTQQILEKLGSFNSVKHNIVSYDFQPTVNNGIIAFVNGDLSIDGGQPLKFSQVFHLCVGGSAGYYCHNDLFRLNLDG